MATGAKAKTNGSAPNGAAPKGNLKVAKAVTPSPTASGTVTPVGDNKPLEAPRTGRPDKAVYDAEQEQLKTKIAELQEKMNGIQNKINAGSNAGPGAERRKELRAEMDKIRQNQGNFKNSRGQIITQLKSLNDGIAKKVRVLQLDKQVESGTMKVVDEKRALQEISQCKRLRKTVENFEAEQESIERDRAAVEDLRKQLDDPEAKAVSEHADAVRKELDELKRDGDEAYANRNKLFDERNELKAQLDVLFGQKRESALRFREDNDRFYAKLSEDRARRAERARAQRAAEEDAKKEETARRLREEAEAPAYQAEIEDCQTLIDVFSGKAGGAAKLSTAGGPPAARGELQLRQVAADADGLVARKKKGTDEDTYFVGGAGKGRKGKRGGAKPPAAPCERRAGRRGARAHAHATAGSGAGSGALNVPLPTLAALLALSIPPPASAADVPRAVADLQTKKAWFEANQARATAENVPPNGDGERPPEPTSTPAGAGALTNGVSADEVDEELEEEAQKEAED
ncbi:hypothetical protein DFH11DRAFT_1686480 [Phellopilus nigrolimitatus]|nr:hypothetical protein DFH11DRAFT_1686480 [Phellopilus nigrolimitatus]